MPNPAKPGYKHFYLSPVFPEKLDEATVALETGYGAIHSAWKRKDDGIIWTAEVPLNTTATVTLRDTNNYGYEIGPGHHVFHVNKDGKMIEHIQGEN